MTAKTTIIIRVRTISNTRTFRFCDGGGGVHDTVLVDDFLREFARRRSCFDRQKNKNRSKR